MSAPSSRAAEVLDRLAREQHRRPLFRRESLDQPDGSDAFVAGPVGGRLPGGRLSAGRLPGGRVSGGRRLVAVALGTVGIAVLGFAFLVDRRAPAVEERLPLASEEPAPSGGSTTVGATPPSGGAPGGGDEPTEAAGTQAVFVHIGGAVTSPGVVELPGASRVVDAVRAAGGLVADADPDRVNLAAELVDGQRIVIPRIGQPVPAEVLPTGPAGPAGTVGSTTEGTTGGALVDLNAATTEQLEELPGVGPATAAAIIAHREREGPFRSVDGLIDVRGIGEAKLEALRDLVTVGAG